MYCAHACTHTLTYMYPRAHARTRTLARRVGAILGLGLAYAGSHREEIAELLTPIVADTDVAMVSC